MRECAYDLFPTYFFSHISDYYYYACFVLTSAKAACIHLENSFLLLNMNLMVFPVEES